MTGHPDVAILAHHGLLLAIPAFVPAFIVAGRHRLHRDEGPAKQRRDSQRDDRIDRPDDSP